MWLQPCRTSFLMATGIGGRPSSMKHASMCGWPVRSRICSTSFNMTSLPALRREPWVKTIIPVFLRVTLLVYRSMSDEIKRQYVNYLFFKVDPAWRRQEQREQGKSEFEGMIKDWKSRCLIIPF